MKEAAATRVHCPWCTTRVSAQANVCHRCGAIKMKPPLSMIQIFFLHPLAASVAALAGLTVGGLSVVKAGGVFIAAWMILSLIHVAFRQRRRWVQLEPLLLKSDETEQQASHAAPFQMKPWYATAATVTVGLALIWATAPRAAVEQPSSTTLALDGSKLAPAPVAIAMAPTPREALPPTAAPQPLTSTQPLIAQPVAAQPQPTDVPVDPMATAAIDTTKPTVPDRALVMQAQRHLSDLGYDVGGVDGKIGSRTRNALKTFRDKAGISGEEINPELIAALEAAVPTQQFAATPAPVSPAPAFSERAFERPAPAQAGLMPAVATTNADTSLSTATLNREYNARRNAETQAPAPAPVQAAQPQRTPVVAPQVPVDGSMVSVPRPVQRDPQAPVRLGARPQQQADASSVQTQPSAPQVQASNAAPIHTLVPTVIPVQTASGSIGSSAIPPRDAIPPAPVRY